MELNLNLDIDLDGIEDLSLDLDLGDLEDLSIGSQDSKNILVDEIGLVYDKGEKVLKLDVTKDFGIAVRFNEHLSESVVNSNAYYLLPEGQEIINLKLLSKFIMTGIDKSVDIKEIKDNKPNTFERELIKNHLVYYSTN